MGTSSCVHRVLLGASARATQGSEAEGGARLGGGRSASPVAGYTLSPSGSRHLWRPWATCVVCLVTCVDMCEGTQGATLGNTLWLTLTLGNTLLLTLWLTLLLTLLLFVANTGQHFVALCSSQKALLLLRHTHHSSLCLPLYGLFPVLLAWSVCLEAV